VRGDVRLQLGRLIVAPLASVGILAACLMWEMEHVGSIVLALSLVASGVGVAVLVARGARRRITVLSDYYEALLRTADEQSRRAETANRLKDDFLATLSHELRTPLNSILGWSRLLSSGKLDSEAVLKAVQAIERSGWAQARVVDDLLDMSRIVGGKLKLSTRPMLVAPIITAAVQSLQHAAESKHIVVETSIESPLGPLVGDPERLQQIVWNLLSNAIKFTPPGGIVKVDAARAGNDLHLSVGDTGIGFEDGVAAHLFERFRQGDSSSTRQFGGLGLGLGIVRYLTELHGGTVDAESPGENRGATFHVRLPLHAASATPAGVPPVMETPSLHGLSVLLVDADRQMADDARSTLEQYGATVSVASSAREARERLRDLHPHVLVSDMLLPDASGVDLIKGIRSLNAQAGGLTPAAALTRLARAEDRETALRAGFQMHVAKPADPVELAAAVEHLARAPKQTATQH
jgi:signal transduction histidine kinase/ActR/RegA family two-component response regulator